MKAVFLDRDGTINVERENYVLRIEELEIMEPAFGAIRLFNQHQLKSIVITNQSCIGRGLLSEEALGTIHAHFLKLLAHQNAHIDSIYYCPHHPLDLCACRKPNIGMLERAAKEQGVHLAGSYMIGDRDFDILAGKNAGCTTILVLTGAGKLSLERLQALSIQPDWIFENILEAAHWITKQPLAP
ncbi:MAG: HAD family hydrolase [Deltaproteobacteria bacterium]|nr:HAD family hydrolase [Deltaproteobacteria bacterium]